MRKVNLAVFLSFLFIFSFLKSEEVKMEAKVYFKTACELFTKLGDFFSELDIATAGEEEEECFIVIITNQKQIEKIREKGFKVEITYYNIKDKFREITKIDPDNLELLRDFGYFFTYWEMVDTIQRLANNFPNLVRVYDIGRSHQNRPLWCVKISDYPDSNENEPAVFFNAATHAREPMGVSILIYYITYLLTNYDPTNSFNLITWLINNREIYFIPVMNPDGYVYNSDSGGASANWRKNRRIIQSPYVGVDLNRNYGYKWAYDNIGSSPNPSSEAYRGPERFSEPETRVVRDFMLSKKIRAQIDYHTYGRYNMYPWGYDTFTPPDVRTLREVVDSFRLYNNYSTSRTGQIAKVLYTANGNSADWEYADTLWEGVRKFITYAFVIEASTNDFWYGWNDSSFIRQECQRNLGVNIYLTKVSGAFLELKNVKIYDFYGNRDSVLNPNESAYIYLKIRNRAIHPIDSVYNLFIKPITENPYLTIIDTLFNFPNIMRNDSQIGFFKVYLQADAPSESIPINLICNYFDDGYPLNQSLRFKIYVQSSQVVKEKEARNIKNIKKYDIKASLYLPTGQRYKGELKKGIYFFLKGNKGYKILIIK
ncbi:MAG: M14 family metallopeptidase [candidate division WOR-3 bacterium]|nr:M14 family metallopeptidase [candidate division WOR-3 bacterium]